MRILIYGAGVIGSLYACLFSRAGCAVSVYARGDRLRTLQEKGLLYRWNGRVECARVTVLSALAAGDRYDYVFLTVRADQLHTALRELRCNVSPNIVTMVNSLEDYACWERLCGTGRIIPAFPGAGGGFRGDVLEAQLTPRLIQPTTFGEIDGRNSRRLAGLAVLCKRAGIPWQVVPDMHAWQLCHLAMVVPLADAYYLAQKPETAGRELAVMAHTARRLRENFRTLRRRGVPLSPAKMQLFLCLPLPVLSLALACVYQSGFGALFMYRHAMKAPEEMRALHTEFYGWLSRWDDR